MQSSWRLLLIGAIILSHRRTCRSAYSGSAIDRDFAIDFFQIPPHDGHPWLSLTVPATAPYFYITSRQRRFQQVICPAYYILQTPC